MDAAGASALLGIFSVFWSYQQWQVNLEMQYSQVFYLSSKQVLQVYDGKMETEND